MVATTGELARKTCELVCDECEETVEVTKGEEIPECPACGNESFTEQQSETGGKDG